MRIRSIVAVILLFLLFLLFLLLQMPAAVVAPLLKRYSGNQLELSAVEGSIWQGRAQVFSLRGTTLLESVQWRLSPWGLLLLQLRGDIGSRNGSASFAVSSEHVTLSTEGLVLPLAPLSQLDASLVPFQLRGRVELLTQRFSVARDGGAGSLQLRLLDLGSGLVAVPSIGHYRIQVSPMRNAYRFTAATERGPLRVTGDGRWQPGKGGAIRLQLHPEDQAEALRPLLSLAGRPAASGDYYLNASFR